MRIPRKWLLFGPALLYGLGFLLNAIVITANHGQMPFQPHGLRCPELAPQESLWVCMNKDTRLKWLADWIVIRSLGGTASPGDFLEWTEEKTLWPGLVLWAGLMIKDKQNAGVVSAGTGGLNAVTLSLYGD